MHLTSHTARLPLARVLALAALLCASALQVQEVAHGHWYESGGGYAQCLLCKSSGSAAPALEASAGVFHPAVPAGTLAETAAPRCAAATPFFARGPPDFS